MRTISIRIEFDSLVEDHSKRNERKRMSIGRYRINKSFNRMEEFCGKTDFLKGRNL